MAIDNGELPELDKEGKPDSIELGDNELGEDIEVDDEEDEEDTD